MLSKEFKGLMKKYVDGPILRYMGKSPNVKKYLKKGLVAARWTSVQDYRTPIVYVIESYQLKRKEMRYSYRSYTTTMEVDPTLWEVDVDATKKRAKRLKNQRAAAQARAERTKFTRAMTRAKNGLPRVLNKFEENIQRFKPSRSVERLLGDLTIYHKFTLLSKMTPKHRALLALVEKDFKGLVDIINDGVLIEEPSKDESV